MPRRGRGRGGRGRGGNRPREEYRGSERGRRWQSGFNEAPPGGGYTGGGYAQYGGAGVRRQGRGRWSNAPQYQSGDFGETDVGRRERQYESDRYQGDYRGSEFETGRSYGRPGDPNEMRFGMWNREGSWGAGESGYGQSNLSGSFYDRDAEFGRSGARTIEPGELAERNYERGFGRGPYTGRGPRNYARSDERIIEEVCELLTDAGELDASNIDVRIEKGEVTLEGTVSDRRAKRMAEDIAERARGVRDVHNRLRVSDRGEIEPGANPLA